MVAETHVENPRTITPSLEVSYDKLNPNFHRTVAQIARRQMRGWLRVDGLTPQDMETVREVLKSAEGQRLPVFHYVGQEYLPIGETDPVEERHTRFEVLDTFEGPDGIQSLAIDVPIYSEWCHNKAQSQLTISKKELAGIVTTGLVADMMAAAGIRLENLPLTASGAITVGAVCIYAVNRLLGPISVRNPLKPKPI